MKYILIIIGINVGLFVAFKIDSIQSDNDKKPQHKCEPRARYEIVYLDGRKEELISFSVDNTVKDGCKGKTATLVMAITKANTGGIAIQFLQLKQFKKIQQIAP